MVRDPLSGDDPPDLQSVLDALDDPDCRTIIQHLDEPMTASEVSEECDIPMSTTYRKLDLLTEASLLAEGTEIRSDGHHATRYRVDFEQVEIGLTEERSLEVSVGRPARSADERLASLWGEVRKET
jgi:DNA-binding IclR family transcriptional regulator